MSNTKSPDVPGEADIATERANVSVFGATFDAILSAGISGIAHE